MCSSYSSYPSSSPITNNSKHQLQSSQWLPLPRVAWEAGYWGRFGSPTERVVERLALSSTGFELLNMEAAPLTTTPLLLAVCKQQCYFENGTFSLLKKKKKKKPYTLVPLAGNSPFSQSFFKQNFSWFHQLVKNQKELFQSCIFGNRLCTYILTSVLFLSLLLRPSFLFRFGFSNCNWALKTSWSGVNTLLLMEVK